MSSAESILRSLGDDQLGADPVQTPDFHAGEYRARAAEALSLWLRWNAVYENVTTAMFERRVNQQQLQESMDLADQLRQKAVQLTQELVGQVKP